MYELIITSQSPYEGAITAFTTSHVIGKLQHLDQGQLAGK